MKSKKLLKNPNKVNYKGAYLPNTKETWRRLGERDSFSELGLEPSALEEFLKDWASKNDYNNI